MIEKINDKFYQEVNKEAFADESTTRLRDIAKQREIYTAALNELDRVERELTGFLDDMDIKIDLSTQVEENVVEL